MTESKLPTDRYWITLPPVDLGAAVAERFQKYTEELEVRGKLAQYRLARRRYYGGDHSGRGSSQGVQHGGEQGESSELTINHYGSIVTVLHGMATQDRPAFQAAARDDSADSLASVQLVDQLLEYELGRGAEAEYVDAVRRFLIFQESGLGCFWHPEAGDIVVPPAPQTDELGAPVLGDDGTPRMTPEVRAGELRTEAFSPFDVARDLSARAMSDLTWQIVRRRVNKWDLAALYPEHEGEILGAPTVDRVDLERNVTPSAGRGGPTTTDTIYVLELYALPTPAVPAGRYARVCGATTLEAGDLQYARLPVGIHAPERTIDEATGSARTVDLLGPQEAYDAVMSNLMSNNDAFGRGNVITAEGQDLDVEDIGGGLQQVQYTHVDGAPPPMAMNLPRLSPEDLRFAEALQEDMQALKAISGVVRGNPEESLKSGSALALVAAQAAQHNTGDQRAAAEMLRDWANRVIETYRRFATTERVIHVTGTDDVRTAETFVNTDLDAVLSVDVQIANPYLRTIAGKKELADFYADAARFPSDQPLTRAEHMTFMSTGRLQPLFRSARSEAIAIREENEALARGEPVMVLKSDNHKLHYKEHKALLDGRYRMKLSAAVIRAIDDHCKAHDAMWVRLTIEEPHVLAATGQDPAPLPMMAASPGGPPGAPGAPPPANDNGGGPPAPANDNGQPQANMAPNEAGEPPSMPNMPINPQTGQRAPAPGGVQ